MKIRTLLRIFAVFFVVIVIASAVLLVQVNTLLSPVDVPVMAQNPVLVTIPSGSSSIHVANILEDGGLIRHATAFRYYAKYKNLDHKLQAGNYLLSYGMTLDEILFELSEGNVYRPTIRVTIPEGFTIEQIAKRLVDYDLVDYDEFMDLAGNSIPAIGQVRDNIRYNLEGYLFPDTYDFDVDITTDGIIRRMQGRMEEVFTQEMRDRAEELGLSVHEVLTLASLVEREVQAPIERDMVAGVMLNRLKINMPLQIDAAVLYALGEHKKVVTIPDTKIDNPYNIYKYPGLPPGPIAAPGKDSIMAVLYPADVEYLYYVTKGDGTGTHYFGKTFSEHQANIRKWQQNRQ